MSDGCRRTAQKLTLAALGGALACGCFTPAINQPPTVTIDEPGVIRRGENGTFTAEVSDPDGGPPKLSWATTQRACPPNPSTSPDLPSRWSEVSPFVVDSSVTQSTFCVWARAVDDGGATTLGVMTITPQNNRPVAKITVVGSLDPMAVHLQTLVMLSAHDSFDEDAADPQIFTWRWGPGASDQMAFTDCPKNPTHDPGVHCFVATQPGTFSVLLTVSDGLDSDTDAQEFHVLAGHPPIAMISVVGPQPSPAAPPSQGPFAPGTEVTFSAEGSSDADNDALTFTWTVDVPWATLGACAAFPNDPSMVHQCFTATAPGTYTISVTAFDGTYTSAPKSLTIEISDPAAP
jgi:hypothetical protein